MDSGLKGKTAMVSGASKGIGRAIAKALAREGVQLSISARQSGPLEEAAREIEKDYAVRCVPVVVDFAKEGADEQWMGRVMAEFGTVDILVNNAADIPGAPFLGTPEAVWRSSWDAKMFGYVRMAKAVFPVMRDKGGGAIVNVIGISARQPMPNYVMGSAACAALMNFTKALSIEGAPFGIRVNGINPGVTQTERWESLMQTLGAASGISADAAKERILSQVPLGRPGQPEDMANAAVFLASGLASYITGTTINVDGGLVRGY